MVNGKFTKRGADDNVPYTLERWIKICEVREEDRCLSGRHWRMMLLQHAAGEISRATHFTGISSPSV
ncbi:hypothetical protein AALO_G00153310 [Alosa alosa]|uniref:Uncharacterized protein n=1 Tax=Alosa alosa TaxID=278164 RepID=A0AAV6GHV5_9TELE|nr:hypothetical protein AALO_G00153310 [Alosa alosa]